MEILKQLNELNKELTNKATEEYKQKLISELKSNNENIRIKAEEELFILNYKLVLYVMKPYIGKGADFDELFDAGSIGFINGLRKFDVSKGYELSTYICYYIKKGIYDFLSQNRLIQIPEYMQNLYIKYLQILEELNNKNIEATDEMIAAKMNITVEQLQNVINSRTSFSSLNQQIDTDEGDGDTLEDLIPNQDDLPEDIIYKQERKEVINDMLNDLMPQEKYVIERRFGVNDTKTATYEIIANELNSTIADIKKIENSGLRKLSSKHRKQILKEYV